MSNIDWSQLITQADKDAAAAAQLLAEQTRTEDIWRVSEVSFIADQLMAIEDGDPSALPGTDTQWRSYRTLVRNWKTGGDPDFPDATKRPTRPTGA